MKRSKSALPQKMKKDARCASGKSHRKGNKNAQVRDPWPLDNQSTTERPHTERNRFEERLTKIQQGFDDLERNLNLDKVNKTASPRAKCDSPGEPTNKKGRRLFAGDSSRKTAPKSKRACPVKHWQLRSAVRISDYHSCVYQKSLYDVIKILAIQKNEIARLNSQIRSFKLRK